MRTVAVMPVKGREPLLLHSVQRLTNLGITVICAGHSDSERLVCESAGAVFYYTPPTWLLGNKIQYCVDKARWHTPDYLLIMGSSDFITDNWMDEMMKVDQDKYMMSGTAGCYFLDVQHKNVRKMIYWGGYTDNRKGEPGGIGRVVNKKVLDLIGWQLFHKNINSSLDGSTMKILALAKSKWGGEIVYNNNIKIIKALSISTYRWDNMHKKWLYSLTNEPNPDKKKALMKSSNCVEVQDPDTILIPYFPEAVNLFNE